NTQTKEQAGTREEKFMRGHAPIPAKVAGECMKNGVFFLQMVSTLLFAPPLSITEQQINEALDVVDKALEVSDKEVVK
ncbi:MAG: aspartate aminotransferase family protein, partial [Candidatus Methanofastidiosa archaeon]|nr:aspartate aminotransferase family protein [Candidatus Methanofastidiosa archaeon]